MFVNLMLVTKYHAIWYLCLVAISLNPTRTYLRIAVPPNDLVTVPTMLSPSKSGCQNLSCYT